MSTPFSTTDDATGSPHFGRFVILGTAGVGAMGTVYAAYDPALDRRVALKVLRSSTAGQQRERIRREALAMARVNHVNVVQVYEVGEHERRLFIAMEFVAGSTLKVWQSQDRGWRAVARMYAEVARGLAAAHAVGLVHRDFKPDNVLVGVDGRPRIIDFGLARAAGDPVTGEVPIATVDGASGGPASGGEPIGAVSRGNAEPGSAESGSAGSGSAGPGSAGLGSAELSGSGAQGGSDDLLSHDLTRTGHVMGTPAYMAPEVMNRQPPSARSDQFAFGVSFYEGLCGQPPFPRDSLVGLKLAVTRGEVQPPPGDRELPGPLARLVLRTLAPDPEQRFPSMQAIIGRLESIAGDEELVDWRPRMAILSVIGLVLIGAVLGRSIAGDPATAAAAVRFELIVGACILLGMAPFHRAWRGTPMHRRAAIWLLLMTPAKVMLAVVGWTYGVEPEVLRAFDTVLITLMNGVAAFLVHLPVWPAVVFAGGCLAALVIEPSLNAQVHAAATISLMVVVIGWAALAVRRTGLSGVRRRLRSRLDRAPGGRG